MLSAMGAVRSRWLVPPKRNTAAKRAAKRAASKATASKSGKASSKAAKALEIAKLARQERHRESHKAGHCLTAHTRDDDGMSNKDYAYRIALLHRASIGERCTLADMRAYGFSLYADSKLRTWLSKWPTMHDDKLLKLGSLNVPKASTDWRCPRSKAAASKQLNSLLKQLGSAVRVQIKQEAADAAE